MMGGDLRSALGSMRGGDYAAIETDNLLRATLVHAGEIQAWRHPLGFIHLELTPLVQAGPGERLRLHIWDSDQGVRDGFGSLHDHVWGLRSAILIGSLRDELYRAQADSSGAFYGAFLRYGELNRASGASRFNLEPDGVREMAAPGGYEIPPGLVHMTTVLEVPTLTLVLATDDRRLKDRGPLVLSRRGGAEPTAQRARVGTDVLESALQELIGLWPRR